MLPHFASLLGPSSSSGSILDTLNFRVWLSSLHATSLLPADTPPCNDESFVTTAFPLPSTAAQSSAPSLHRARKVWGMETRKTASKGMLGREDIIFSPNDIQYYVTVCTAK